MSDYSNVEKVRRVPAKEQPAPESVPAPTPAPTPAPKRPWWDFRKRQDEMGKQLMSPADRMDRTIEKMEKGE